MLVAYRIRLFSGQVEFVCQLEFVGTIERKGKTNFARRLVFGRSMDVDRNALWVPIQHGWQPAEIWLLLRRFFVRPVKGLVKDHRKGNSLRWQNPPSHLTCVLGSPITRYRITKTLAVRDRTKCFKAVSKRADQFQILSGKSRSVFFAEAAQFVELSRYTWRGISVVGDPLTQPPLFLLCYITLVIATSLSYRASPVVIVILIHHLVIQSISPVLNPRTSRIYNLAHLIPDYSWTTVAGDDIRWCICPECPPAPSFDEIMVAPHLCGQQFRLHCWMDIKPYTGVTIYFCNNLEIFCPTGSIQFRHRRDEHSHPVGTGTSVDPQPQPQPPTTKQVLHQNTSRQSLGPGCPGILPERHVFLERDTRTYCTVTDS
jgi:hypothetical protein